MIEGYIGRPGSGKTYTITERVVRAANRGRPVFTNYPVRHPGVQMFMPADLLHLPPGLIVIDEAHLWFPARMSLRLPPSWLAKLSQTRKSGWDLLWSTQHEARVDRVIRDITNWMYLCSAWFTWNGHPLVFTARSWEPEFFRGDKKHSGPSTVRLFSRSVAAAYSTLGTIAVADHATSSTDPYAEARPSSPAPRPLAGGRARRASSPLEEVL